MDAATPSTAREAANLFGELAVREGFVTREALDDCLREQARLARDGCLQPLGQILLQRRLLSTEQFLRVLERQRKTVLSCGRCRKLFAIDGWRAEELYACRGCGEALGPPATVLDRPIEEYAAPAGMPRSGPVVAGVAIGKYEVLSEIARGGMGIIYLARDHELNRYVVLKVLREDATSDQQIRRLRREATAAARLRHPNIVTVHDVGEEAGVHYIVMEYVDGRPLDDVLRERSMLTADFLRLFEQVARAVHYAHENGVVHRDLKPGNILIGRERQPIITDFGLAKVDDPSTFLTQSGIAAGTPHYMAPEQVRGEHSAIDGRTDVYALGAILYEHLTGRPPFGDVRTAAEVYQRIVRDDPPAPRALRRSVDPELETICMRCLDKERARRYASAQALADDVRRFLDGEPIHARPTTIARRLWRKVRRRPATAVAVAMGLAIATGVAALAIVQASRQTRREQAQRWIDEGDAALVQGRDWKRERGDRRASLAAAIGHFTRAVEADPDSLDALLRRGEAQHLLGDLDAALADFRRAVQLAPQSAAAHANYLDVRATQYELAYDREQARLFNSPIPLRRVSLPAIDVSAHPDLSVMREDVLRHVAALQKLESLEGKRLYHAATLAYVEGRHEEALRGFEAAAQAGYAPPVLGYRVGACCVLLSDAADAPLRRDLREKALGYFDDAARHGLDEARLYATRAQCLFALHGDTADVRRAYDAALALYPDDVAPPVARADYHAQCGRAADAVADYERALGCGGNWTVRLRLASALARLDRHAEAVEQCTRALGERPNVSLAHMLRGWSLLALKRYDDAEADARAALAIEPANAVPYDIIARARYYSGDIDGALQACLDGRRVQPGYGAIGQIEGQVHQRQGRHEQALEPYTRCIEDAGVRDDVRAQTLANRATCRAHLGRFQEALDDFDEAWRLGFRDAALHLTRSNCLYALRRPAEALAEAEKAIELGCAEPTAHYHAGIAALQAEQFERALKHLDRAVEVMPDHARSHGARGDALVQLQRHREALAEWQKAARLDPAVGEILRQKIDALRHHLDER